MFMKLLDKKTALVTSATRGIGLACSKKLAENGAKVYLAVRRLDAGKEAANEIIKNGGNADIVYFDALKEETFTSMIEDVIKKTKRGDYSGADETIKIISKLDEIVRDKQNE